MAAKTEVTGTVVRDKMAKSRVVAVERQVRHETYGKAQRLTSTFMAHDEQNETRIGDVIAMVESRPLSARKRWVIVRIVKRAVRAGAAAQ
jgi:small subunit ribosomal protein S17